MKAIDELNSNNINSPIIYLDNFGPEIPAVLFTQRFEGPVLTAAAAEEKILFDVLPMPGIKDILYNKPKEYLYNT